MLRLQLLRGPVEADLGDRYPGVRVRLRRLTSLELEEARQIAIAAIRNLDQGRDALAAYGLGGETGGALNLADPGQMLRLGYLVETVEVALKAVEAWTGVTDEAGAPAPITRESLAIALLDDGFARRLVREIDLAARILVAEGNGSGASPNGSSERGGTAWAPTTAATAPAAPSPAPPDDRAGPAATVPKSRRPPKRSKA